MTVPWAVGQLVVTEPDEVNFDDITTQKHTVDDNRSMLTYNSKYSINAKPKILLDMQSQGSLLDGKKSAAAREVDYFGDKKHGRDNMSYKDFLSIRSGEMVQGP